MRPSRARNVVRATSLPRSTVAIEGLCPADCSRVTTAFAGVSQTTKNPDVSGWSAIICRARSAASFIAPNRRTWVRASGRLVWIQLVNAISRSLVVKKSAAKPSTPTTALLAKYKARSRIFPKPKLSDDTSEVECKASKSPVGTFSSKTRGMPASETRQKAKAAFHPGQRPLEQPQSAHLGAVSEKTRGFRFAQKPDAGRRTHQSGGLWVFWSGGLAQRQAKDCARLLPACDRARIAVTQIDHPLHKRCVRRRKPVAVKAHVVLKPGAGMAAG